ncbi:DinB family protein [Amycolatopsis sp. 195334CR]|uniref:DinB family protein n=1 Tax=Amycolatopsis sp. 195334CR TaxID=2814588 RepID=UPI001A8DB6F9|nr:DinB family protein [Amycolatopsis sp. 195334CR]MBN6038242.1 DinB family protein [Amycolatopsis sp. 195334CR]
MTTLDQGPPRTGPGEKEVLAGFLDYLRASVAAKAEGVPEPQVRTRGVPSGTNLLGLVKHLTHVERHWLLGVRTTNWGATFRPTAQETAENILAEYRETTARANEVIARAKLTEPVGAPGASLRWTLTHLVEETARHAGHADILRELVDGSRGR